MAIVVKEFVQKCGAARDVTALVCLDVKGAFDAASWPTILKELISCGSPNNLYKFIKRYLTKRSAILATNSTRMEKGLIRECPQVSCITPGYWNL